MEKHPVNRLTVSRRDALKIAGLLAGSVLAEPASLTISHAEEKQRIAANIERHSASSPASLPPLPPLAVIALNRMGFGPRPGDIAAFNALPGSTPAERLRVYVDTQLNPTAIDDSACDAKLAAPNWPALTQSLTQLWSNYYINIGGNYDNRIIPVTQVRNATILRATFSKRQLLEVMTDFWHNHFNVYAWDYEYASPTWAQYDRDIIRAHALGNFRQMLEAVGTSTAMLYYLDNYTSMSSGPNENYARELFELHGLGTENYLGVILPSSVPLDSNGVPVGYVDNDVIQAARCFTGWTINDGNASALNDGTFLYYGAWHDSGSKSVLGNAIPANQPALKDGRDIYDMIAAHPGTARYIARKLCRRLIADIPPQSIVDSAAAVFTTHKDAPDQIAQVVRTILLSTEFQTSWGLKIKRPLEAGVSALRAMNIDFTLLPDAFFWTFDRMGQILFGHQAPDGYLDMHENWSGTQSMLQRWALVNQIIEGKAASNNITLSVDLLSQMPASIVTPDDIADFWIDRLLGRPMDPSTSRDLVANFIAQGRNPTYNLTAANIADILPHAVELILMSPDFQWR